MQVGDEVIAVGPRVVTIESISPTGRITAGGRVYLPTGRGYGHHGRIRPPCEGEVERIRMANSAAVAEAAERVLDLLSGR